jgi:hypothetical protein
MNRLPYIPVTVEQPTWVDPATTLDIVVPIDLSVVFRAWGPFPALRLHDLRHTAASLMLASGMNMHEVATALGHANSSITAKVYAHLLPSEVVRSSERYDAWMEQERTRAQEAADSVTVLRRA